MKRQMFVIGLALTLTLILTSVVCAEGVRGTGELHAWGDGMAGVRGDVEEIIISGNGTLFIRDQGGDGEWTVSGTGRQRDLANGWTAYYGFDGAVEAHGSQITVLLSGYDIDLQAKGTGAALLYGEGGYATKQSDGPWSVELSWSSELEAIQLQAPAQ